MKTLLKVLVIVSATLGFCLNGWCETDEAESILRRVSEAYKMLQTYQDETTLSMSQIMEGMETKMESKFNIAMQRPNKLAIVLKSGMMMGVTSICDGEKLYTYMPMLKKYTVNEAPENLEGLVKGDLLGKKRKDKSGLIVPSLFGANPYELLMENVNKLELIGKETIEKAETHRIILYQEEMDVSLWIDTGNYMIRKINIDMSKAIERQKDLKGDLAPSFGDMKMTLEEVHKHIKLREEIPSETFVFKSPEGAEEVDSLFGAPSVSGRGGEVSKEQFKRSLYLEWGKDREEAIKRLGEEGKNENKVAVYGYVKFSDKGIEDIKNANIEFRGENWSRASGQEFKDGSFYWTQKLKTGRSVKLTLTVSCPGYEVVEKKFEAENGKMYDLGEIVLQKVSQANLTAGIKGKVLLPDTEDNSGVKVEAAFKGVYNSASPPPSTYTSTDGSFQLTGLQPGRYTINFSHPEFVIGKGGWQTLKGESILDLGEIKAAERAVIYIEWVREKELGKGFEKNLRGEAVLRTNEGKNGFDFNRGIATEGIPLKKGMEYINKGWEPDIMAFQSGEPVPNELLFIIPHSSTDDREESFILDLGEKSINEVMKELDRDIKNIHNYKAPVKSGHCYLVYNYDGGRGYLGIVKVLKIEK